MVYPTTNGTRLAGISWVYINYFNACKFSFIFNKLSQTIKTPIMEAAIVFTAFSCRRPDSRKGFQFNGTNIMRNSVIDNGPADFVVLVSHPPLFFVIRLSNGLQLLGFTKLLTPLRKAAPDKFVLPAIPIKPDCLITHNSYRRTLDAEVYSHNSRAKIGNQLICVHGLGTP